MSSPISRKELIRKLKLLGYNGLFSAGKHQFMKKDSKTIRIPNPHKGDISIDLLREILKQANLNWQEWNQI
jgi:predicted RNA binding protein YcfA (HicA-like mRNA interferase family)